MTEPSSYYTTEQPKIGGRGKLLTASGCCRGTVRMAQTRNILLLLFIFFFDFLDLILVTGNPLIAQYCGEKVLGNAMMIMYASVLFEYVCCDA